MLLSNLNNKPEIFSSIQGEGPSIGKSCIFIRLANCTLSCRMCDSKHHCKNSIKITPQKLINKINSQPIRNIIFTGGEPLIQQEQILQVITQIQKPNWIEIETNGTIKPLPKLLNLVNQINCSPKFLAEQQNKYASSFIDNAEVINTIKKYRHVFFKIVVQDIKKDIKKIKLWQKKYEILNNQIWLMPKGTKANEIINGTKNLMQFAKECYNISTRLHIILFNNKKGI